jgi:hypothetical protein
MLLSSSVTEGLAIESNTSIPGLCNTCDCGREKDKTGLFTLASPDESLPSLSKVKLGFSLASRTIVSP